MDSSNAYDANVRIVAGSSKILEPLVRNGTFREELYFKLSVIHLQIPALRERREDIPDLIHFLHQSACDRLGGKLVDLSDEAIEELSQLEWRGNLPQLENMIERLVLHTPANYSVLSSDIVKEDITKNDVAKENTAKIRMASRPRNQMNIPPPEASFRELVKEKTREYERVLIQDALQIFEENITKTARHLGISRKGLQNKIRELRIR